MLPELPAAAVDALVRAGALFHSRGWVPATAGNLSFRAGDAGPIAITRSGCHKGELTSRDLVAVGLDGAPLDAAARCSAETLIHCRLYARYPHVGAVLHTHSVWATLLSRERDRVVLSGYEVLKALAGVTTHATTVELPVFDNDQDIARLAGEIDGWLAQAPAPHGFLIRGHGLYAWGETVTVARHRVEALEFLLECEHRSAPR